ncbi:MAG: hypothetical protein IJ125_04560 [Atopobiaceae bacterium]|nr:hypothetical protein [Atopobiaceae bacterium]
MLLSFGSIRATFEPSIDIAGIAGVKLGSASLERPSALSIRTAVREGFKKLKDGQGILFTIDEAQAANRDEMVALATAVQEIIGDEDLRDVEDTQKKGIAFVFAGLSSMVDELINDDLLTFLRRAIHHKLGYIALPDVRNAFEMTMSDSGFSISMDDAMEAARASSGYPYMIQLVGYYMWQSALRRRSNRIEAEDVQRAKSDAALVFLDAVCAPAYRAASSAQQAFLDAMLEDWPQSTPVSGIAQRVEKSTSWVSAYRKSLIDAHLIEPAGGGKVSYSIPHFGEYMAQRRDL